MWMLNLGQPKSYRFDLFFFSGTIFAAYPSFSMDPLFSERAQASLYRITCRMGLLGIFTATRFEGNPGWTWRELQNPTRSDAPRGQDPLRYHVLCIRTDDEDSWSLSVRLPFQYRSLHTKDKATAVADGTLTRRWP
ncbi:hypothetical protein CMEL01_12834 [Colletotrichum melonis]|uniref:Uncharacterized protein n=3 Tax=Colletotrichum acutatum species complex TaxID=2707335 RepID=A0AAI9Z211_9PEZI|nr:uncharacterized protein CCOS01_04243 [Colletotrichum costaricense]XP_060376415.1 uncharacterized protein CTAM01_12990 [Colletotrichum tamarilloi]KAI3539764.1 hypothetical protein CSPX01_08720 [Colletotrichum filicis]KAK1464073.1 hypothetical protein CMEL01_12834 [Colletotrichum melonis]KAK1484485.1 hypothetical protein CTAM01_12990 [Colletotrichum tamarilloi]KAK1532260.1 hypothetical protein CCOS01_04243 [Colletotrichum costaricense]